MISNSELEKIANTLSDNRNEKQRLNFFSKRMPGRVEARIIVMEGPYTVAFPYQAEAKRARIGDWRLQERGISDAISSSELEVGSEYEVLDRVNDRLYEVLQYLSDESGIPIRD